MTNLGDNSPTPALTVAQALQDAVRELCRGKAKDSPRLDAEVLLAHVADWTRTELHLRIRDPLSKKLFENFQDLVARRAEGVPVAYLIGWKEFFSHRFRVGPGVLVPRPETEGLVEHALGRLRRTPGPTRALDLGCGSGCIAISLALMTMNASVLAVDISPAAISQTLENINLLGVEDRVEVIRSDLFSGISERNFDLIVSNPPYVGTDYGPAADEIVTAHEPKSALFSGPYGTDHLKAIVERAPRYLIEGGSLVLECACFQAETVEAWMADIGFSQCSLWHDLTGLPRGASGRWEG